MRNIRFLFPILIVFMSSISYASDKIGSLKLVVNIDTTYKQVNQENWQTLLTKKLEDEPTLAATFNLLKNGTLPTVFYTKNLDDPLTSNILINQMEGYSKIEEGLIPKIKTSLSKLNTFRWSEITIIQTKNNLKGVKLSGYVDDGNPAHTNITYWLEDPVQKRLVSFSFNNLDIEEVTSIINSVRFYLKSDQALSQFNHKIFSISYPTSWDTTKQDNSVIFMAVEGQKNERDLFKENVAIYIEPVDPKITLESVVESTTTAFKQESRSIKDILERGVKKNSKLVSYGLFKTRQLVKEHIVITTTVVFKKGNRLIMISFFHDNAENTYYSSLYNSMIDSFELK